MGRGPGNNLILEVLSFAITSLKFQNTSKFILRLSLILYRCFQRIYFLQNLKYLSSIKKNFIVFYSKLSINNFLKKKLRMIKKILAIGDGIRKGEIKATPNKRKLALKMSGLIE